ncbi:MAG: hypothetical protein ACOZB3_03495 [Calditrichota bacterium]
MDIRTSRPVRRFFIAVNYGSLFIILAAWYGVLKQRIVIDWLPPVLLLFMILVMISFYILHIKTGLWRLVHTKTDALDERQVQITHDALRYSYSIFSIVSLIIILAVAVLENIPLSLMDAVMAASLIYLAHTLPASVLGWKEREV